MGPPWAGPLRGELGERHAQATAFKDAPSGAKLVRLSEGVKLVVHDFDLNVVQGSICFVARRFPVTAAVEIRQEWSDFLVSLQPFRSQRIERLRASAEITTA